MDQSWVHRFPCWEGTTTVLGSNEPKLWEGTITLSGSNEPKLGS